MTEAISPLVSVVIPTYNRARSLVRAVDSVLAQTYPAVELLIVDDASSDGTAAQLAPYLGRRVLFHRSSRNCGAAVARNIGIGLSTGDLIAFLDSDDDWLPNKLQRQVDLFRSSQSDVGLLHTGAWQLVDNRPARAVVPRYRGQIYDLLRRRNRINTSTVMVRRDVLQRVGGFDERLRASEDWDLWLRIAAEYLVDVLPEPLVRHRDSGEGRVSQRSGAVFLSNRTIYKRHNARGASRRIRSMHLALCARELYRLGRFRPAFRCACGSLLLWPTPEFAPRIALRTAVRLLLGEAAFRRAKSLRSGRVVRSGA
jgi:glycosyltransferase involved in cell wall biosynthesis